MQDEIIFNYNYYHDQSPLFETNTDFDSLLETQWKRAESKGCLRYSQPRSNPCSKYKSENEFKFVFQFLKNRGELRRGRVQFDSINEPFSHDRFNFLKIKKEEILFEIESGSELDRVKSSAIVNVSPIEWGHYLLVPQIEQKLPQRLTEKTIKIGIEIINLSKNPHMRLMFNSLLAWASVNHLHYHCIRYPAELVLDNISLVDFHKDLKLISSFYPLRALAMEIQPNQNEIEKKSKILGKIINLFYELDIAHNVVIVRSKNNITRFFIFPRVKADTAIVSQCVDPACVEFSGQFPCKAESEWNNLEMKEALELLGSVKIDENLENKLFQRLKTSI